MSGTLRLALLGFWHVHARDYIGEARAGDGIDLVSAWDPDGERGRREASGYDIPFQPDLDAILGDPAIDGVIVTTATADHLAILPRVTAAGKHLFVEKVLEPTLEGALQRVDEAVAAGVTLTVALSRAEQPALVAIRDAISAGRLGRIDAIRVRVAHDGCVPTAANPDGWLPGRFLDPAEASGGALIDLGAHPLYLVRLLAGHLPVEVSAEAHHPSPRRGDDSAIAMLRFPDGALGVAETSFMDGRRAFSIEVRGSAGAAWWRDGEAAATIEAMGPDRTVATTPLPLPSAAPTPFERWVALLRAGTRIDPQLPLAVDLSALEEAAALSIATGRTVRLADLVGADRLGGPPQASRD